MVGHVLALDLIGLVLLQFPAWSQGSMLANECKSTFSALYFKNISNKRRQKYHFGILSTLISDCSGTRHVLACVKLTKGKNPGG